jgi:hypothetical protein
MKIYPGERKRYLFSEVDPQRKNGSSFSTTEKSEERRRTKRKADTLYHRLQQGTGRMEYRRKRRGREGTQLYQLPTYLKIA